MVFAMLHPSYDEVIMYSPAIKLMFNLACPVALVARSYITPLMLKETVALANAFPCPST